MSERPHVFNSVFVSHSGIETRYWASLFRGGSLERSRGPFTTAEAAAAAFLPVKVYPAIGKFPEG